MIETLHSLALHMNHPRTGMETHGLGLLSPSTSPSRNRPSCIDRVTYWFWSAFAPAGYSAAPYPCAYPTGERESQLFAFLCSIQSSPQLGCDRGLRLECRDRHHARRTLPGIVLSESRKMWDKDDLGGRVPLTKNHHAMQSSPIPYSRWRGLLPLLTAWPRRPEVWVS